MARKRFPRLLAALGHACVTCERPRPSASAPSIGALRLARSTHLAFSLYIAATGPHVAPR